MDRVLKAEENDIGILLDIDNKQEDYERLRNFRATGSKSKLPRRLLPKIRCNRPSLQHPSFAWPQTAALSYACLDISAAFVPFIGVIFLTPTNFLRLHAMFYFVDRRILLFGMNLFGDCVWLLDCSDRYIPAAR